MRKLYLLGLFVVILLASCQGGKTEAADAQVVAPPESEPTFVPTETPEEIPTSTDEALSAVTVSLSVIDTLINPGGSGNGPIYSLDWAPDGVMVAAAGYERVDLWNVATEERVRLLTGNEGFVWGVDWSPDGKWIAAASDGGTVMVWDALSGEASQTYEIAGAFCLNWSPESDRLVVGTKSGVLYVLDTLSEEITSQTSTDDLIIAVKFSPLGELLAIGKLNGEVDVYETGGLELLNTLDEDIRQRRDANGLDWSPDGTMLASAHQDGAVRIWDVASGELIRSFRANYNWIRGIAWSSDGEIIAAAGSDVGVRLWEAETGEMLTESLEHDRPVWCVSWSPDGDYLATGEGVYESKDSRSNLLIWEIIKRDE
jgi:WD40 repeat protein